MRALACDGSEVPPTSEGRTGGHEPAQRHERATSPMQRYGRSPVRDGLRDESPRGTELPEEAEDGNAVSTGLTAAQRHRAAGFLLARTSRDARGGKPTRSSPASKTGANDKPQARNRGNGRAGCGESRTSGCASSKGWRVQEEENLPGEKPEPWSSESRGTGHQPSEASRPPHPWDEGACPGRSARERTGGPASAEPRRPSLQPCRRRPHGSSPSG
jgi:hypothetical protein